MNDSDAKLEAEIEKLVKTVQDMTPEERDTAATSAALSSVALLEQIRDATLAMAANAATGAKPPEQFEEDEPKFGWKDALKPIAEPFQRTRLGRIGSKFMSRFRPAARAMKAGNAPKPKTPKVPSVPKAASVGAAAEGAGVAGAGAGAEAAAGAGAAGATGAAAAAPPVAIALAAVMAFKELGEAAYDVVKDLHDFAYGMADANKQTAQYNAQLQAAYQALDASRTFREIDKGAATEQSGSALADSIDRLEEKLAPLETIARELGNFAGAALVEVLSGLLTVITETNPLLKAAVDAQKEGGAQAQAGFGGFLKEIADQEAEKRRQAEARIRDLRR